MSDSCLPSRRNGHVHSDKGGNERILAPIVADSIRVLGLITATTALKSTVKYEIWDQRGKVTCRRSHSTKRQKWGLTQVCLIPVPLLLSLTMVALDSIRVLPPINTVMVPQGE